MRVILLIYCLTCLIACKKHKDNSDVNSIIGSVTGNVKYGAGDCMPILNKPENVYHNYSGDLYFIVKKDLDNLGNGNLEQLKSKSIKRIIKDGALAVELPVDTFLVMPVNVYQYSDYNTVIIKEGISVNKDFKFWNCTSY